MSDEAALLDVVTPPPGQRLVRGVWLTHDLTITALNDILLPVLAGLGTTERSAAAAAPGLLPDGALIVLAAGDQVRADALVPAHTVRVIPVTGRRQHAKVAILQFERTDPQESTATGGILTLVTSANLTAAGLTTNREVYAAEWLPTNGGGDSIAGPVLSAMRALAAQLDAGEAKTAVTRQLAALTKALTKTTKALTVPSAIAHSLEPRKSASFPQTLAGLLPKGQKPSRVLLVGPAFASDTSNVAQHLKCLLSPGVHVDLVVGTFRSAGDLHRGDRVEVPTALLTGLRQQVGADHVHVHAAATNDESGQARILHGKTIIVEYPDLSVEMLGSANITTRGLTGHNREVVAFVTGPQGAVDAVLASVRAVPLKSAQIVPVRARGDLASSVTSSQTPIAATFTPDPGQDPRSTSLIGTLSIPGHVTGIVTFAGRPDLDRHLAQGRARIEIDIRGLDLSMEYHGVKRNLLVAIAPHDGRAFWTAIPVDTRPEPVDAMLQMLLRDYAAAGERTTAGSPAATGGGSPGNDGFSVPATRRLNLLTRYRRGLTKRTAKEVAGIVDQFFPDPNERIVAHCVANATQGVGKQPRDPVLKALAIALQSAVAVEPTP